MLAGPAWADRSAPTLDDFETLSRGAFDALPETFRTLTGDITIAIADFPADDVLKAFDAESPFEIMGLFEGIGIAHAPAVPGTGALPNRIWLYRRPILDYWAEHEETLAAVISHVLIHEIGHHFGLSDEDMEGIEAATD